jgi:hypothetical protein
MNPEAAGELGGAVVSGSHARREDADPLTAKALLRRGGRRRRMLVRRAASA